MRSRRRSSRTSQRRWCSYLTTWVGQRPSRPSRSIESTRNSASTWSPCRKNRARVLSMGWLPSPPQTKIKRRLTTDSLTSCSRSLFLQRRRRRMSLPLSRKYRNVLVPAESGQAVKMIRMIKLRHLRANQQAVMESLRASLNQPLRRLLRKRSL